MVITLLIIWGIAVGCWLGRRSGGPIWVMPLACVCGGVFAAGAEYVWRGPHDPMFAYAIIYFASTAVGSAIGARWRRPRSRPKATDAGGR